MEQRRRQRRRRPRLARRLPEAHLRLRRLPAVRNPGARSRRGNRPAPVGGRRTGRAVDRTGPLGRRGNGAGRPARHAQAGRGHQLLGTPGTPGRGPVGRPHGRGRDLGTRRLLQTRSPSLPPRAAGTGRPARRHLVRGGIGLRPVRHIGGRPRHFLAQPRRTGAAPPARRPRCRKRGTSCPCWSWPTFPTAADDPRPPKETS